MNKDIMRGKRYNMQTQPRISEKRKSIQVCVQFLDIENHFELYLTLFNTYSPIKTF